MLNLFYKEPDPDRWAPFDRYPRRLARRLLRGRPRPGGHTRVFLNLRAGLDRLGVPYRVNDFGYARRNPQSLACIVGKPHLLDQMRWENPILFGAAVFSHPLDDPGLFERLPVRRVLVPGPWMARMCAPYWGERVSAWPVGIDTDAWSPRGDDGKDIDVLIYDKIMWRDGDEEPSMLGDIRRMLEASGRSFLEIRYGHYCETDYVRALGRCKTMIFLCEHETQGIAYQQALSAGVPIFAWDEGGPWRDPAYYPDRVTFAPVSSTPYWDDRCGRKFSNAQDFVENWPAFWDGYTGGLFSPRDFILENLTLEKCASAYVSYAEGACASP